MDLRSVYLNSGGASAARDTKNRGKTVREEICFRPIGWVKTDAKTVPRHWSVSQVRGELHILPKYEKGLKDIKPGDEIIRMIWHSGPDHGYR